MKHDYIVLIVGKSGTGKSTICGYLEADYGVKELRSYTTRPRRGADDNSYIFVSDEEFDNLDGIVAYTEYNGYRYCATEKQIEECDTYIIDPDGVDYFLKKYTGKKIPMVVYIATPESIRGRRMAYRGQSDEEINNRLELDTRVFCNVEDYATVKYVNSDAALIDVMEICDNIYDTFFREESDEYGRKD